MFGRLLQQNIATLTKESKTYLCDLRAIPLPQGGEGKRLYCHVIQPKLKGLGDIVTANNVKYDCELKPMWHGGHQLYCRRVRKTTIPSTTEPPKRKEEIIEKLKDVIEFRELPKYIVPTIRQEKRLDILKAGLNWIEGERRNYLDRIKRREEIRDLPTLRRYNELLNLLKVRVDELETQKILATPVSREELNSILEKILEEHKSPASIIDHETFYKRLTLKQSGYIFKRAYPIWEALHRKQFIEKLPLTKKEKRDENAIGSFLADVYRNQTKQRISVLDYSPKFREFYNQFI